MFHLPDDQIENIGPMQWEPRDVTIPYPGGENKLPADMLKQYDISDSAAIVSGGITFRMNNTISYGNVKGIRVQDILAKNIIENNLWKRPIYFAVTCSDASKIGLDEYLRLEGMASRVVPIRAKRGNEFIDESIMRNQLLNVNPGYSKSYKPGFKFRGLDNPNIFYDDTQDRMLQNYRHAYIKLAVYYLNSDKKDMVAKTLDMMEKKIPYNVVHMDKGILFEIGSIYYRVGAMKQYFKYASEIEELALKDLEKNPGDVQSYYNPYRLLNETYQNIGDYKKLLWLWKKLKTLYPDDPNVNANVLKFERLAKQQTNSADSLKK